MTEQEARDEREALVNYCPEHGDLLNLPADGRDTRSFRCREAHSIDEIRAGFRKHPEPEITEARIDAAAAILMEGEGPIARVHFAHHYKRKARAMLEAALRVPVGEGEQQ